MVARDYRSQIDQQMKGGSLGNNDKEYIHTPKVHTTGSGQQSKHECDQTQTGILRRTVTGSRGLLRRPPLIVNVYEQRL